MKRIPLNIFFLCIFLPPICYILTLQALETYFQRQETARLNRLLIQDLEALYEGRYTLKEEIHRNLQDYYKTNLKYRIGVITQVIVKTKDDRILYPTGFDDDFPRLSGPDPFSKPQDEPHHYVDVAANNYRLLNEGLVLSVHVRIRHNSWLSNGILVLFIFLFFFILMRFVKKETRDRKQAEDEQNRRIQELAGKLVQTEATMKKAETKEAAYRTRISELNREKEGLSEDLEAFMKEMEDLETGLVSQKELKENMEEEVLRLQDELDRLKERQAKPAKKDKKTSFVMKRFRVLYKDLIFTDRAIEGFLVLTNEYQLKAEEVIHRLNSGDATVPVKRKVFGKGGKKDILELAFSYAGRIYIQKRSGSKTRILAIGNKNTQDQDLAYLERLK